MAKSIDVEIVERLFNASHLIIDISLLHIASFLCIGFRKCRNMTRILLPFVIYFSIIQKNSKMENNEKMENSCTRD